MINEERQEEHEDGGIFNDRDLSFGETTVI